LVEARVLLLAGAKIASEAGQRGHLPAKVFEYLAAARPILTVAAPASDLSRLLGAFTEVVEPGNHARVAAVFTGLWRTPAVIPAPQLQAYWSRNLAKRLASVLNGVAVN
jgi:hypothetical protein